MQIFVRYNGGTLLGLDVDAGDGIEVVKAQIQSRIGNNGRQILKFNGVTLLDGNSLANYNVHRESVLDLTYSMQIKISAGVTIGAGVTLKVPVQKYSLGWDGTEHYVHITGNQSDWNLGDLWTIEWWEKLPDASPGYYRGIIGQSVGNTCLDVWHNSGFINLSNAEIQITQPEPGVWHHIAVQKDGATVTAYIDGVQQTLVRNNDGASTYTNGSLDLIIGDRTFNGADPISQTFKGLLANIKISNVARYSGAFTPSIALETDANTLLAISGELVDLTGRHTITNNGVSVSTDFPT
jgi:hypothetical protein